MLLAEQFASCSPSSSLPTGTTIVVIVSAGRVAPCRRRAGGFETSTNAPGCVSVIV
jgi:hypothetical protein